MTLCISWIRKKRKTRELYLVADSCLTGGEKFLAAPKIFPLKRGDCAIACAGATNFFYPIVEQITRMTDLCQSLRDRSKDFLDVIHTIVDVSNKCMHQLIESMDYNPENGPEFSFLIVGFSCRLNDFRMYEMKYDKHIKKMSSMSVGTIKKMPFGVIGDYVKEVRRDIFKVLEADGIGDNGEVEMQPLDVLLRYIGNDSYSSIGGFPQMIKIYPFMQTLPIGFTKEDKNGQKQIYYYGRPLLKYETFPYPMYDLDRKCIVYMKEVKNGFERVNEKLTSITIKK